MSKLLVDVSVNLAKAVRAGTSLVTPAGFLAGGNKKHLKEVIKQIENGVPLSEIKTCSEENCSNAFYVDSEVRGFLAGPPRAIWILPKGEKQPIRAHKSKKFGSNIILSFEKQITEKTTLKTLKNFEFDAFWDKKLEIPLATKTLGGRVFFSGSSIPVALDKLLWGARGSIEIKNNTLKFYEGSPVQFIAHNSSKVKENVQWALTQKRADYPLSLEKNLAVLKGADANTSGSIQIKPYSYKVLTTKMFRMDELIEGDEKYDFRLITSRGTDKRTFIVQDNNIVLEGMGMGGEIRIASVSYSMGHDRDHSMPWQTLNKNKLNINEGDYTTIGLSFDDTKNNQLPKKIFWSVADTSTDLDRNDFSGKSNFLNPNKTNPIRKDKSNNIFPINFNIPSDNIKEKKETLTINFWADKKQTQQLGEPLKITIKDAKNSNSKPDRNLNTTQNQEEENEEKPPKIQISARFDPYFKVSSLEHIPHKSRRVKINGTTFRGYEGTPFQFTLKNKSDASQEVTWILENAPSGYGNPSGGSDNIRNLTNRRNDVVTRCFKRVGFTDPDTGRTFPTINRECGPKDIYNWINTRTSGTVKLMPNETKSVTKLFERDAVGQGEITYPMSFFANGNMLSTWKLIVKDVPLALGPGSREESYIPFSIGYSMNMGQPWQPLNKNKLNISEGDNATIGLSFDDTKNSKLPKKIFWSVGNASSGLDQNDFLGKSNFLKPNKTNPIRKDKSNNTFPINFNIPSDNSKEKKESLTINFWADKKRTQPLGDPFKIIIKDVKGTIPKSDPTKPDATKPDATKPDATKPDATKPDAGINPNTASQPSFSVDLPPVVVDRSTSIQEDIKPGKTIIDLADANSGEDTDNAGNKLTYTIETGNDDGLFSIDPNSGVITIATGQSLNYDTKPAHKLTVEASDGSQSGSAVITINVKDVSGYPAPADTSPSLEDQTVQVIESIKPGDEIVDLSDASGGDTNGNGDALTYAISSGNDEQLFKINSGNGKISLSDEKVPTAKFLDYETKNIFTLGISASADGKTDTAQISIQVQNQTEQFSLGSPAPYSWTGDDITGSISNSATSNWISLPLDKGRRVSLGFNGSGTLDSQNNVYVKAVYNDFGHLVEENTYFKEFNLTSYDITAPYSGTYYVEVKAKDGETGSYGFGATANDGAGEHTGIPGV